MQWGGDGGGSQKRRQASCHERTRMEKAGGPGLRDGRSFYVRYCNPRCGVCVAAMGGRGTPSRLHPMAPAVHGGECEVRHLLAA